MHAQTQVVATPVTGPGGGISYSLVPQQPQQYQAVTFRGADGQEQTAIVPVQHQGGLRAPGAIQLGAGGLQLAGGLMGCGGGVTMQNITVRNGNVLQTVQVPVQQPQPMPTLPVQIPVSIANGQTIFQTIQVPMHLVQNAVGNAASFLSPQTMQPAAPAAWTITPQGGLVPVSAEATAAATGLVSLSQDTQTQAQAQVQQTATVNVKKEDAPATSCATSMENTPAITQAILNIPQYSGIATVLPPATSSTASTSLATVTVPALPQTVISSTPSASNYTPAPTQLAASGSTIQSILLPNGQVVQAQVPTQTTTVQVVDGNGQVVHLPVASLSPNGSNTVQYFNASAYVQQQQQVAQLNQVQLGEK
jgi:hypothetical protein